MTVDATVMEPNARLPRGDDGRDGDQLFECVILYVECHEDFFEETCPVQRHRLYVWAAAESEAYLLSEDAFFEETSGRGWLLANWYVRPSMKGGVQ